MSVPACLIALLTAAVVTAQTPPVRTQTPRTGQPQNLPTDGLILQTCKDWRSSKGSDEEVIQNMWKSARLGFAHGAVAGLEADPLGAYSAAVHPDSLKPGSLPVDEALDTLLEPYMKGLQVLGDRPLVLFDSIERKCADAGDDNVKLPELTLVIVFEAGGLPAARVSAAVDVLRRKGSRAEALTALRGKSLP